MTCRIRSRVTPNSFAIAWKDKPLGHTFIAENHNGIIHYYDPQTGESDVSNYFINAVKGKTRITRVDKLDFTDYIKDCVEKIE